MNHIITIDQHEYHIGRMNALTQFHVLRRIAPVLAPLGATFMNRKKLTLDDMMEVLGPVTEVFAKIPEEDANYVIFASLATVKRIVDGRQAPVTAGEQLMFEDIDAITMLRLTWEVVETNLQGFFAGLGDGSKSTSS